MCRRETMYPFWARSNRPAQLRSFVQLSAAGRLRCCMPCQGMDFCRPRRWLGVGPLVGCAVDRRYVTSSSLKKPACLIRWRWSPSWTLVVRRQSGTAIPGAFWADLATERGGLRGGIFWPLQRRHVPRCEPAGLGLRSRFAPIQCPRGIRATVSAQERCPLSKQGVSGGICPEGAFLLSSGTSEACNNYFLSSRSHDQPDFEEGCVATADLLTRCCRQQQKSHVIHKPGRWPAVAEDMFMYRNLEALEHSSKLHRID